VGPDHKPAEELDWSIIHPDHRDRLLDQYRGSSLAQTTVDALAITYPAEGKISVRSESGRRHLVDLVPAELAGLVDAIAEAEGRLSRAKDDEADARTLARSARATLDSLVRDRNRVVRDTYASGVPASHLVDATGLSLPRVNQIVAGARK
jgi:hypothetical protein